MSKQSEKVVKIEKKKPSEFFRRQIKIILICIAVTICCCTVTAYVTQKHIIENPYKATIDIDASLPCGLPFEMRYIDQIESGIYVVASYYGMCVLDINIDDDQESAEVYIAFYPGNIDTYGFPTYRRYTCNIINGNLIESSEDEFILSFDPENHQIKFRILCHDFSTMRFNVDERMLEMPFTCIWLDPEGL